MPGSRQGDLTSYESLRLEAKRAGDGGRTEDALRLFRESQRVAERMADPLRVERAICNQAPLRFSLGDYDGPISSLMEIHSGSQDPENSFLAAYNLACAYYFQKNHRKALFFSRVAVQRASLGERRDFQGWGHNQLANILLALNEEVEAAVEYERALELLPAGPSLNRGRVLDNLGYCRVIGGRVGEAFSLLVASWRMLRRCGAEPALVHTHLDLAYAYLDVGRSRPARRHAERALELADRVQLVEERKNALFLLGEACLADGDRRAALEVFDQLQQLYPETPYLAELLLAVDVRQLVNLKA